MREPWHFDADYMDEAGQVLLKHARKAAEAGCTKSGAELLDVQLFDRGGMVGVKWRKNGKEAANSWWFARDVPSAIYEWVSDL